MEKNFLENLIEKSRAASSELRIAIAADVIIAVMHNAEEGGSFSFFIEERLGLPLSAFVALHAAGGQILANTYALPPLPADGAVPHVFAELERYASALPRVPHLNARKINGEPVMEASVDQLALLDAFHAALVLIETNRQLTEANNRLSAQLAAESALSRTRGVPDWGPGPSSEH